MDQITNGWFTEKNDLWPGQRISLEVEQVLFSEKSDFQDILVLQTKHHGRALILDGIIQCTENDEFSYQEMISFIPLCVHPNPANVLIVGGGDGGVAREVQKHPSVSHITQVEIDGKVIEASKQYLPFMAQGFASPKLNLVVGDGFEFMKNHQNEFDVIVTDSSDPVGPAINLFTEAYFELLKTALKPNGVICSQGGTVWAGLEHVRETIENCSKHFGVVKYATASVPTYPTGQIGFIVASLDKGVDLTIPKFVFGIGQLDDLKIRYYSGEMHASSFVLPNFVNKLLYQ